VKCTALPCSVLNVPCRCRAVLCGGDVPSVPGPGREPEALPDRGVPFLAALAFHGGLAAILVLYCAFWVEVSSAQAFRHR